MKKIAVLNDLSGMGKCSLTAAIPVISVMGVQACPLPTAVLSNQTGYESYFCDDYTDCMGCIMAEWQKRDFHPDGIYTGYLAGEQQAEKVQDFFKVFADANTWILVDPVLGDSGRVYGMYTEGLLEKMRGLVTKAHVITPNLTEALLLLYGKDGMEAEWKNLQHLDEDALFSKIGEIGRCLTGNFSVSSAVITGIDVPQKKGPDKIGNLVCENGRQTWVVTEKTGGSYSGTGDLFASVLSAGLVKGQSMEHCVKKAVDFLSKAIADAAAEGTDRNDGVCFETYLYQLREE